MARVKQKLRGSVSQSVPGRRPTKGNDAPWLTFGVRLALLVAVACVILIGAAWFFKSDWPERQVTKVENGALTLTQKANFAVKDIAVEGRNHTEKNDLFAALGVSAGHPILAIDPEQAAEKVRALPWVEDVTIERRLPDSLYVKLTERTPIARWQHQGRTVVIDRMGKELAGAAPEAFMNLPLVVGADAPANTEALLHALRAVPEVLSVMKAASRVGGRRWDLYLGPKVIARLPEDGFDAALLRLARLMKEQKILDRAIVAIDLRVQDRLVIEPATPETPPENKETKR
jgi:cell division protein FtsQ